MLRTPAMKSASYVCIFPGKNAPPTNKVPFSRLLLSLFIFNLVLISAPTLHAGDLLYYYGLAQKNDPDIKAAFYARKAAIETKMQALSSLLPKVEGAYEDGRVHENITQSDNIIYQDGKRRYNTRKFSLTLTQPLFHVDSLIRVNQSFDEAKYAELEYRLAQQDLMMRVSELYLNALAGVIIEKTVEEELNSVKRLFVVARERFKYGLARKTDFYDAQARLAMVESDYIEALNMKDDAFQALRAVCGQDVGNIAMLQPGIIMPAPNPDEVQPWIDNAISHNLELTLLDLKVKIANHEVNRQWSGHLPTVDVVGQYGDEKSTGSLLASGGGSDIKSKDIYLRIAFPIFSGGYTQSKISEATARKSKIMETRRSKRRAVEKDTRAAFLKVKSSIRRTAALAASLESQQLAAEAKKKGFEAGLYDMFDVLEAQRMRYVAERDYEKAKLEYVFNSLKLKQITGTLCEDDIARINQFFADARKEKSR